MARANPLFTSNRLIVSPVDYAAAVGGNMGAGNFTASTCFYATKSIKLTGIRMQVAFSGGGTKNFKLSLYNTGGTSPVATNTISGVSTGTIIESAFSSVQTLTAGVLHYAAAYETGGAVYGKYAGVANSAFPAGASLVPWGGHILFAGFVWAAGDARPATGTTTEFYGVEPVIQ